MFKVQIIVSILDNWKQGRGRSLTEKNKKETKKDGEEEEERRGWGERSVQSRMKERK